MSRRTSSKNSITTIYLDTCILIAYFSTNKEENEKKKIVKKCFKLITSLENIELVTSHWALSETVNVLISRHKMKSRKVSELEERFIHTERLDEVKVQLIDSSLLSNYSVKEFLYEVRGVILKSHPGLGDAMHYVIMHNNNIATVLTFDSDFTKIPGLTVLDPTNFIANVK